MSTITWPKEKVLADHLISLFAGTMVGMVSVVTSVSLAALIFSGQLKPFLGHGIGMMLFTAVISGTIISLFSSCQQIIAIPQDRIAPLFAVMGTMISMPLEATHRPEEIFITVTLTIVSTTILTGLFFYLLGQFKVGSLIRYLPLPVIGGFLAGTGWLLIVGGMRVVTELPLAGYSELALLFDGDVFFKSLYGLIVALFLSMASQHKKQAIVIPLVLLFCTLAFFSFLYLKDIPLDKIREQGWLLNGFQESFKPPWVIWQNIRFEFIQWSSILHSFGDIVSIFFLSGVSILITISAVELMKHQDLDVDRELKLTGLTNIICGLSGGVVGFHSLSLTGLGMRLGGCSRSVGLVAATLCALGFFSGPGVLGYLPKPVLGGLLIYLGFTFLREWLLEARNKLPAAEYLLIPLILAVIVTWGFLAGLIAGLLFAVVLFVVHYSQIGAIRFAISGKNWRSFVERNPTHDAFIKQSGDRIYIIALHGYLFFGTTRKRLTQLQHRIEASEGVKLDYALFDFKYVVGIDYSAAINFIKIAQFAEQHNLTIIFTGLSERFRKRLINSGLNKINRETVRYFVDLDHGFEWYENQILESKDCMGAECVRGIFEDLADRVPDKYAHRRFIQYFDRMEVPAGYSIITQGESAHDLYFLTEGEVSVYLENEKGAKLRLRKTEQGTVVGEMGFYLQEKRSASVITDKASVLYRLTKTSVSRMEKEEPALALVFHRFMAEFSSQRLLNTTMTISQLLK